MNDLFKLFLSMSIAGSVIAMLLFALRPWTEKRFSKAWQYYMWLIVLLRLLIPYSPEYSPIGSMFDRLDTAAGGWTAGQYQVPVRLEKGGITAQAAVANRGDGEALASPAGPEPHDFLYYAGAFWLLVAMSLFAVRAFRYGGYMRYIRASFHDISEDNILEQYAKIKHELGIKRRIPLYQSNLVKSPMLIGLFKPVIVIGEGCLHSEGLEHVFRHEMIHYRRFDIWYKWLVQLSMCVHWFNPLIYLISLRINRLCEFSCDEAVVEGLDIGERMKYCKAIINAAAFDGLYGNRAVSMTLCEEKKALKERLGAIIYNRKKSKLTIVLSIALAAVLCSMSVFLGAYAMSGDTGRYEADVHTDRYGYMERLVVIDPGHGGIDTGCVHKTDGAPDISEKELNLEIALLLRDMLEKSGVSVVLTRQEDRQVTLEDRMKLAELQDATLFVSIHINAGASIEEKGTATLYNPSEDNAVYGITGRKAAGLIQEKTAKGLGTIDAGIAAMPEGLKYNSLKMPAAIVELAYITNEHDRKIITDKNFKDNAARALYDGILSALKEME